MPEGKTYMDGFQVSDRDVERWLDAQDDSIKELPDDREFRNLDTELRPKRFARLRKKLAQLFRKRRKYVRQFA